MKLKKTKFILPFFMFLLFFITIFTGGKVLAANYAYTDLYFPNTVLASGYNSNGSATIKDTLVVYAHNNGAGYQLGDKLRVSKLSVQVGNSANGLKEYSVDSNGNVAHVSVSNGTEDIGVVNPSLYGTWAADANNRDKKYVGKIVINIANIMKEINNSGNSNDVTITISFQRYNWFFGVSWPNYETSVRSYKGINYVDTVTGSATIKYNITDESFATNNFKVTSILFANEETEHAQYYNYSDYRAGKDLNLEVKFNFPFKNGSTLNACVSTTKCSTLQLVSNIAKGDVSSLVKINEQLDLSFNSFSFTNAQDLYGSSITQVNFSEGVQPSISFKIDTLRPSISSATLSENLGNTFYDIAEIYSVLTVNETVSYTNLGLKFKIGDKELIYSLDDNESIGKSGEDNTITKTVLLSGDGKVELIDFYITITDGAGNETSYYYNASSKAICSNSSKPEITLRSSVVSASTKDANKTYYYTDDDIEINVLLKDSSVNMGDFESVYLADISNNVYHTFDSYTQVDNIVTFKTKIKSDVVTINDLIFTKRIGSEIENVAVLPLTIYTNSYFEPGINHDADNSIVYLTGFDDAQSIDNTLVSKTNKALTSFVCDIEDGVILCSYTTNLDGVDTVTFASGAIVLNNGMKNSEKSFDLILNIRAPSVSYVLNDVYSYNNSYFYRYGNGVITIQLNDGYASERCLYYSINDAEFSRSCVINNGEEIIINLPNEDGEYTFTYYTSDGLTESDEVSLDEKFIYRSEFKINDISITINDMELDSVNIDNEYNFINVSYSNALMDDLLNEFIVSIPSKGISKNCINMDANTFNFSKSELGYVDDTLQISILLNDHLGNQHEYLVNINIDTVDPIFDNLEVIINENNTNYIVKIDNYEPYDLEVKVEGVSIELSNDTFETSRELFDIYLTDKAGNISHKSFVTVAPYIELFPLNNTSSNVTYEINISPFNSAIHQIEEYRYLVFDYLQIVSQEDLLIAKNNVCTAGRKVNCYVNGNFSSNIGIINQTFPKGYSYIILVKINNVLVNLKDTSSSPRLNIVGADVIAPEHSFLDDDINPDYISSTSGEEFKFSFLANDAHLSDSFYFVVVKSSLTVTKSNFYDLYTNCYGALASSNSCGIKGTNTYTSEISDNTYLGEVIITANNNTRKRLENNTSYSLYVLSKDDAGNESVFKVRDFTNISQSSNLEYLENYTYLPANSNEISTDSTTTIKVSKYQGVDVSYVKVNGENITCTSNGCEYLLIAGRHTVEVKDILGNVSNVVFYSAMSSRPKMQLEYKYNGDFYRLSNDVYSYNTANSGNIYIKVIGTNLTSVTISMGSKTIVYQEGSTLYDTITNQSDPHGITLLSLITIHNVDTDYDGIINISATNDGGTNTIAMQVDNTNPEITLALPGTNINLLGDQYLLSSNAGVYSLQFNYKSDITYAYLLEALNVKIDNTNIISMLDYESLNVKVDDSKIEYFYDSITKGEKLITIDYFDNAGNSATQIKIRVNVIDNESPVLDLRNAKDSVEVNENVSLAEVIVSDNHDQSLEVIAKINGTVIDYTNYKFLTVDTYTVTYYVKDSSNNEVTITQTINVIDTRAPVLKEGTNKQYSIGVTKTLEFEMPKFVDNDPVLSSDIIPYQIRLYGVDGVALNPASVNYPLTYDDSLVRVRFASGSVLGTYKIVFIAKDTYGNAVEEEFVIVLSDENAPIIEVSINGKHVDNESLIIFPFNSSIDIVATARDIYEGDLTHKLVKEITLNGKKVTDIDVSKSGNYLVEFSVTDLSGNESVFFTTIKIAIDNILPNIDKVYVNGVEINEGSLNKFNAHDLTFNVDANDDSNYVKIDIVIDDGYNIKNGELISLESGLSGHIYNIRVEVTDSSANKVVKNYDVVIDNVSPLIAGVNRNEIYSNAVSIDVNDSNIKSIIITKDGEKYQEFNTNISSYTLSEGGFYTIAALDTYGNEVIVNFVVLSEKKFPIVDESGSVNEVTFDEAFLLEVRVDNGNLNFMLDKYYSFDKNDQLYILVKYPNSTHKYIIYSMNGETYNNSATVMIEEQVLKDVDNVDLLEKIGDKYYAYAMVIKSGVKEEESKENSFDIMKILMPILMVLGLIIFVVLFIKLRRRVRAV